MSYIEMRPGQRLYNLVIIARSAFKTDQGGRLWWLQCDCGEYLIKSTNAIRRSRLKSCGCLLRRIRRNGAAQKRHRHYSRWMGMLQRCYNPKSAAYNHYGGRGIKVCSEWKNDFWALVKDIGDLPSEKHSLDRINNDGNYEPSNVRWATQKQQRNNSRTVRWLTLNGVTKNISSWSLDIGISVSEIRKRLILKKWSVERSLTTPKKHTGLSFNGTTKSVRAWSKETGINRSTLRKRLKSGSADQAFGRPVTKYKGPIKFKGVSKSAIQWAAEVGISDATMRYRIEHWGIERAITTKKLR